MESLYVVVTVVAALSVGYAAALNFARADLVKVAADRVQVSYSWMLPLGTILATGALGLLGGFVVPELGLAAAAGLVVYFTCAVLAHVRVGDRHFRAVVFFLLLAVAALATGLAHHEPW